MQDGACDLCRKHASADPGVGRLIARLDGFWVFHAPAADDGRAPLGYLYLESDRHAPFLADLTDDEAAALGRIRSRLAAGLREAFDPEFVFAAVIGRSIPHFHEHLFVRHRGTPTDVSWDASDEAAPRADAAQVAALVERLRAALGAAEPG
jgi:ATP adenylyltransferase